MASDSTPREATTWTLDNGNTQWWFPQGSLYFWDASRTQINAQIGCLAPGHWLLSVRSPNSGVLSNGVPVTINAVGGCS